MALMLTPRQRAEFKARAHALDPVVHVGQGGATDRVVAEVDRALTAHELIKVKVGLSDREARAEVGEILCARTDAAKVGAVGKVLILWRPRPEEEVG